MKTKKRNGDMITEWTKIEVVIPTGMKYRYVIKMEFVWKPFSFLFQLGKLCFPTFWIVRWIGNYSHSNCYYFRYFVQVTAIKSADISGRQYYELQLKEKFWFKTLINLSNNTKRRMLTLSGEFPLVMQYFNQNNDEIGYIIFSSMSGTWSVLQLDQWQL